jgi:hypothetical protein
MWKLIALASLALVAGCLRSSQFACTTNEDCASGGTCEAVGFCSFADSTCAGGARFGEFSGQYAGKCVDSVGPDAGVDAPPDAMPDAFECPAVYTTLTGAPHRYRAITSTTNWNNQKNACASDGGYLAIPDDAPELMALTTLNGTTDFWVGLTDSATEGTFLTVRGAPATFLPWATGEPNNQPGVGDCVRTVLATNTIADDRCSTGFRAICECE